MFFEELLLRIFATGILRNILIDELVVCVVIIIFFIEFHFLLGVLDDDILVFLPLGDSKRLLRDRNTVTIIASKHVWSHMSGHSLGSGGVFGILRGHLFVCQIWHLY